MTLPSVKEEPDPFASIPPSLDNAAVGDEVLVEDIVSDLVRTLCCDRDIQVGDRLRVQSREDGVVTVRNVKGRAVRIFSPYAFFVRVRRIPDEFTKTLATAH